MTLFVDSPSTPNSIQRLHVAQTRVLAPELAGLAGAHGLWVSTDAGDGVPVTPLLGRWTRMRLHDAVFDGDLRARADEALPFQDKVFRVVALSHALEQAPCTTALLTEAVRVLAADGLLVISGFHALSAWSPWLWSRRGERPSLSVPLGWRQRLSRMGVQTYAVRRFGAILPMLDGDHGSAWLGGGFVLLARKRRENGTHVRLRSRTAVAPVGSLAPGANRECA